MLGRGNSNTSNTQSAIEKLVDRIESLEGIVRNMGKVLGSEAPSNTLTQERDGEQEGGTNPNAEDDENPNPWKTKSKMRAKPNPLSQIMKEALVEQKQEDLQEKREHNIIIFRADESKDAESKRMDYDRNFFRELCTDVLELRPFDIEEVTRLGKPNQDRARPLRIKLKEKADKLKITAKLRNLGNADEEFRGISVADDLSQKDREEIRLLAQEAKNWLENHEAEQWRFRVRGTTGARWVQWIERKTIA